MNRFLTILVVALLATNAVALVLLYRSHGVFASEIDALQSEVRQYRFERTSQYEGVGLNAILEHVTHWAPQLQLAGSVMDRQTVEERLHNLVDAMGSLGTDVVPMVRRLIAGKSPLANDPSTEDEIRKWLLLGALAADREEGCKMLLAALEANTFPSSLRLRLFAADKLIELGGKPRTSAGELLETILLDEPEVGQNKTGRSMPKAGGTPPWYNFVDRLIASEHPKLESILLRIIGKPRQPLMSLQQSVKALGERRTRAAAPRIRALFKNPPSGRNDDALFRVNCLQALADIEGRELLPFLEEIESKETIPLVRTKIVALKTSLGG